jgi:nifR3 family TIM-barrel protein
VGSIQIKHLSLSPPFGLAPMAGMTDSVFRRLVKRHGGCSLVVTEMVSSEGLVRGIDRTLEYAEYTEEERPLAIQIFGGDPATMAAAAQVVEGMGADIVDVNMGCPVPKIAKHNAGCSLMREPDHAASVIDAMTKAVRIPVTVKMRAGWNDREINAPLLARMVEDAGAAAVAVHGRTAAQSYSGSSDWDLIAKVADAVRIPVWGNGDCIEPHQLLQRLSDSPASGVLVGRGILRNPWLLGQANDLMSGRPAREVSLEERGRFLLEYMELLLRERIDEAEGFRHQAPVRSDGDRTTHSASPGAPARGRARWVVNKMRALCAWYTKGLDNGSHLRMAINSAASIAQVHEIIETFFSGPHSPLPIQTHADLRV